MNAAALESATLVSYRKAYEEKMCRIAEIYGVQGDFDNAVKTFKEAEDELSKAGDAANENLARVYTRHLMYVYQTFADKENDINGVHHFQSQEHLQNKTYQK